MARQQPQSMALVVQQRDYSYREYSYLQLDEMTSQVTGGLQSLGIGKGTRTVVMVRPGLEFFAIVFALFRINAVLVAVDPGMGIKNLKQCLAEARPEVFIGNRKAHLARILFGWAKSSVNKCISTEKVLLPGIIQLEKLAGSTTASDIPAINQTQEQDTAAILFTSGSTGPPKGVVYTHANFLAQVKALQSLYNIRPGERDLATFPLFALYAPAMGMTSIVPDMDFTRPGSVDPERIFHAIKQYSATTMFGSPALLDRISREGVKNKITLPTLKRVLSAGAPVSPVIIERFSKLLVSDAEIHTPYGATESLPVSSIASNEVLRDTCHATNAGKGICVGSPVAGLEVTIIGISNKPVLHWDQSLTLEPGQTGEIIVSGPQVTAAYYNHPDATALAKIHADNGRIYHRMGDTGYFDEQGRLWFCGRKAHCVNYNDQIFYSICCEGVFNVHEKVYRTALIGLKRQNSITPALCVEIEPEYKHTDNMTLKTELLALGGLHQHTRAISDIFFHPGFPVDIRHNAKIDRDALARWAGRQKA